MSVTISFWMNPHFDNELCLWKKNVIGSPAKIVAGQVVFLMRLIDTGGEIKGQASTAFKKGAVKTKLGALLYSCHVKGHTVQAQPSSKALLKLNNSGSIARYTLLWILLSVFLCMFCSCHVLKKYIKMCVSPLWRIGFFFLSPNRICKQGCRVWWGLLEAGPETLH